MSAKPKTKKVKTQKKMKLSRNQARRKKYAAEAGTKIKKKKA